MQCFPKMECLIGLDVFQIIQNKFDFINLKIQIIFHTQNSLALFEPYPRSGTH